MGAVPVIDLGSTPPRVFTRRFGEALEGIGFVILTGHGIKPELLEATYGAMARVFAYPDEVLEKYTLVGSGGEMGFTRFRTEHAKDNAEPDLKRFWHVHRPSTAQNFWPTEVPELRHLASELFECLDELSFRLLDCIDEHLGEPAGRLRGFADGGDSLLRLLHYPALKGVDAAGAVRAAQHEDINFFTLLVAGTASGLEVKTRDGAWFAVNEEPGSIVVNSADMLKMLTKGRLQSTTHRVVNPTRDGDGDRYSMPFFVHPRHEVVLDESTGYTAGEYLFKRLREIGLLGGDANEE